MKKFRTVFTFLIVAVVFVLSGCMEEGKAWTDTEPSAMPVPTRASSIETVSIYSVNSDNMTLIPVSVRKETQDPTPDYVAELVMENLNEEDIELTDITQKDNKVIVSFSSEGKPVKGCGSKMETLILEAFANSLLDNLEDCEKVIFRCDGKEYKSSQYSFGKNEVFASE
mgnify:FL=1